MSENACECGCLCNLTPEDFGLAAWENTIICPDCSTHDKSED